MEIGKNIEKAAEIIKNGGLVAFPTETVYGLGANALNKFAVARIFEVKQRPTFDPLIVHIDNVDYIEKLTSTTDRRIWDLASKFWPGPLTIVLPKKNIVDDIVTAGMPTVGLRMPSNNIALELIKLSQCPIAAPSANKFGRISPTNAQHVVKQKMEIDYIIDGGNTQIGIESTVITVLEDGFVVLRSGFITEEDLITVLPKSKIVDKTILQKLSPGNVKSHYSPTKPLYIVGQHPENLDKSKTVYIAFTQKNDISDYGAIDYLTKNGDLREAAINLFALLHKYEDFPLDNILIEPVPEISIGIAIMERLRKAAYKYRT